MKPSDVELAPVPLVATMKRCEAEFAAALLVRACVVLGDAWQPLTLKQVQEVMRADVDAKREPFAGWMANPFLKPDIWALVAGGWGRWTDCEGGTVELTADGISALERWRKPERRA